ncbi:MULTISPECIES: nicotinate-nucleotide--dimethylbenzimidazole phosphoribosyltransferase [unclassified Mesorhizobium]|uniref:nicotinate-nucleotide--dimethylbenzimidazole phosphoribosyltransferase n=1 Tax=unclassified Mesorhizobium TaxID=325217 RepID=UPI00086D7335|nr:MULTISPECIES: nicotinate-nucleotide--dimethylbenzimidazole phosphoribosyltransferase [unclassified Mesorhizobium]MBN9257162.1 nicotinate-nucleotide--dimethylbenzimidazole phosphoribosyltransferase [Mesorhizobium sp.]MBN9275733.1 nicotinate-nucleotide--dimethylbenzimidazole phosphoribosyltransferase [Mesorhizobium sp.]ODT16186.1 MAG: nicotinate-nucleotide--dimethylbenzimidazole phosphoribosyltransferase [Mesorhizobium sp. SCN 65-12]OJX82577.1 MAG: nicotinate-nucleotide--dimethylbenzimidazole 
MAFKSLDELRSACLAVTAGSDAAASAVARRQDTLTKPQGSLGRLETIAAWLARWQGRDMPRLDNVKVVVFAGNHGVTAQGVSAYPSEVTVQMVANFAGGGAAINQLARVAGAKLDVIPLDLDRPTGDFTQVPAMDEAAFLAAVSTGHDAVTSDLDLVCFGEMGIGNTTPAAAISAALFGGGAEKWTGRGTGVDDAGLKRKVVAIEAGLKRHADSLSDPLKVAAALGGRELAAILGATLAARRNNVPVLLDGFVCTAAAAPLAKLHPTGLAHAIAAHVSAEAGHRGLLAALDMPPLLDLGMRLGEGSGACLAINIVRSALECHVRMASFAEAGVSEK